MTRTGRYLAAAIAVFVAVFVALYSYLDLAGYCDGGGCPDVTQISTSAAPDLPAKSVLTPAAAPVVAAALGVLIPLSLVQLRPDEIRLSPELRLPTSSAPARSHDRPEHGGAQQVFLYREVDRR